MQRRKFLTLVSGAAASVSSPLAALAQQTTMPVIGFLDSGSAAGMTGPLAAFHSGLAQAGYA